MARHPACATFQRPAGATGSEEVDAAGGVVAALLPPEADGVWAALREMLRAIAQVVVRINLIRSPFTKSSVEQSIALAGRTLGAPTGGAGNAAHSGANRRTAPRIAADCSEGGSRGGPPCSTANRTPAWTDSSTGRWRVGRCRRIIAGGWRILGAGRCHA